MQLAALLVIAAAYWGQAPACGQPSIVAAPLPAGIAGLADYVPCRITLDLAQIPRRSGWACSVTLHEYGHLTGRQHTLDPNDVMYPVTRPPAWPCAW